VLAVRDDVQTGEVGYAETEQFRSMNRFLDSPEWFLRHLFDDRTDAKGEP
jgi:hypothetical protein